MEVKPNNPVKPHARWGFVRVLCRACLACLVLAVCLYVGYVLCGPNFHTVIPGTIYRCAQPSAGRLDSLIRRLGIRTVINLRGCCDPLPTYVDECRVTNQHNVSQEDLNFSACRLPSVPVLRQLIAVLDQSETPLLLHCNKGADRSGLTSAVALLLKTNLTLDQARAQLGPWYGHLPLGKTVYMDQFFDLYAEWLAARNMKHTPATFRHWATREYCPAECRCLIELLEPRQPSFHVAFGQSFAVRVRCHNTSIKPWHFQPGGTAGIHVGYRLHGPRDECVDTGRAALLRATVAPGESIDVTIPLMPLYAWGSYELQVDVVDEQHAHFLQEGSEPLFCEVQVP